MSTALVTHCGARLVDRKELLTIEAPPPTETWFPLSHAQVLNRVEETLDQAGFVIAKQQLALSRNDARFFGTLDLRSPMSAGVTLAVGIRNSTDKSLPIGFAAGSRVFVCDNLAFRSEITIARKHTRFGEARYGEALALAIQGLNQFQEAEGQRIQVLQHTDIDDEKAESTILRAYEREIVSYRLLPRVIAEWRKPSYEEFQPRNFWSLFNAFTTVLGARQKSNPQQFASLTISLSDLLGEAAGMRPQETFVPVSA